MRPGRGIMWKTIAGLIVLVVLLLGIKAMQIAKMMSSPMQMPATTVTSGLLAGLRASCADVRSADLASRGAKRGLVTAGANSGPRPDGRRER